MHRLMVFIIGTIFCNAAIAGGDKFAHVDIWGGGSMKMCQGDTIHGTKACIGASANNGCKPSEIKNDAQGIIMMVARKFGADELMHYAKFCPTQIEVFHNKEGKNKGRAYTTYSVPNGFGETMCVTLYSARSSDDNKPSYSDAGCDNVIFNRETYSGLKINTSSGSIEDTIPMFAMDQNDKCGHNGGAMEHDIILAIVDWTPGGHGAFVQPLIVASKRSGWKKKDPMRSWPELMPADGSTPILACKMGYRANADNTNCEPIDVTKCAQTEQDTLASMCKNQLKEKYDSTKHKLQFNSTDNCYEFRCSTPGYAFVNTSAFDCVECVSDARTGINPQTGECVKCSVGNVFSTSDTAAANGYCAKARTLSHNDLQYGPGKSKDTSLENQCWAKFGDDYVNCMNGE